MGVSKAALHHVPAGGGTGSTAQTSGMQRTATICETTVGAQGIWMGEVRMAPGAVSGAHHHGVTESAIYVLSGFPEFVYRDGSGEVRIRTKPGDYVFVPPFVPHIESNEHSDVEAVAIIARSSQEAIVENLDSL
ncbi:MAG TPA: cupin domain-containing protein [Candidatus Limnocylindria bacterium]|jgi:uncharacterized RmlC-like cupin family protein|nr:cupin domain-containing protein [Candidatus Limnocylindria bacterium]